MFCFCFVFMSVHIEEILDPTPQNIFYYYTNSLICYYIIQTHLPSYNSVGSRLMCTHSATILKLTAGSPKFQNEVHRHTHLSSCNSAGSLTFQTDEHTLTYHPGTLCRFTHSAMLTTVLPAPALRGARRVSRTNWWASKQATILTSVRGFDGPATVQLQPACPSSSTHSSRPVPDTDTGGCGGGVRVGGGRGVGGGGGWRSATRQCCCKGPPSSTG